MYRPNINKPIRKMETPTSLPQTSYYKDPIPSVFHSKEDCGVGETYLNCALSGIEGDPDNLPCNFYKPADYNEEDPMMSNAINSEDVNSIAIKAKQIVTISKPIIEGQENQLEKENEHSIKTLENAKLYKYLAFAQIAVTVFIGLIQVYNFRRFLKSQHVI